MIEYTIILNYTWCIAMSPPIKAMLVGDAQQATNEDVTLQHGVLLGGDTQDNHHIESQKQMGKRNSGNSGKLEAISKWENASEQLQDAAC
jgi:CCR4-NOT transcriptional regulation complex NOT5 subunit